MEFVGGPNLVRCEIVVCDDLTGENSTFVRSIPLSGGSRQKDGNEAPFCSICLLHWRNTAWAL